MHPELQAALDFGLENSDDLSIKTAIELLDAFFEQGDEWEKADADIQDRRESKERSDDPISKQLATAASAEVDYVYELWRNNFSAALDGATAVYDGLSGDTLAGYRGFWYYLAGVAAFLHAEAVGDQASKERARDLFSRAAKASKSIAWFAELAALGDGQVTSDEIAEGRMTGQVFDQLSALGSLGARFEIHLEALEKGLASEKAAEFDPALTFLGKLLGWNAYTPEGNAKPGSVCVQRDKAHLNRRATKSRGMRFQWRPCVRHCARCSSTRISQRSRLAKIRWLWAKRPSRSSIRRFQSTIPLLARRCASNGGRRAPPRRSRSVSHDGATPTPPSR